jgi:hypothetical protein
MQETDRKTVTLVLGGVRSGKSRWAQQLVADRTSKIVATLFKPEESHGSYAEGRGFHGQHVNDCRVDGVCTNPYCSSVLCVSVVNVRWVL